MDVNSLKPDSKAIINFKPEFSCKKKLAKLEEVFFRLVKTQHPIEKTEAMKLRNSLSDKDQDATKMAVYRLEMKNNPDVAKMLAATPQIYLKSKITEQ
jgi:hypothetical protein